MSEEKIIFDTTPLWEIQDNETRILTEKDYLKKEIKKLKSQLQQKENIIKEVREYIEKYELVSGYKKMLIIQIVM